MSRQYLPHQSVLPQECLGFFDKGKYFLDATFGAGGHSRMILEKFSDSILHGIDQDTQALENARNNFPKEIQSGRLCLHHMNFENFPSWRAKNDPNLFFDGILMDIGVSSHQFDSEERGFSFRGDAPLDMRMNQEDGELETAADILNHYSEEKIADMLYYLGEEKFSRKIAKKIIEERKNTPFETTAQLENLVFHVYPAKLRHRSIHPATKTFQALRIAVNRELEVLENSIEKYFELLSPGGKLLIISFHSLEDRIVKRQFRKIAQTSPNYATILTKKPITATEQEVQVNRRSRSAKLRVLLRREDGGDQKNKYKKSDART
ncbi:MAG: 16S rRNA (cytosine(1402)-N(4))-methyltransferase RsmH [Halobacteriovoraceae bacterium]|nr:16S rRNA (cytosine(1402)-N(4))-methyltransferase RsmH [Halobacteriovoraceae bacterium]